MFLNFRILALALFSILFFSCTHRDDDQSPGATEIRLDTCRGNNFRVLVDSFKYHIIETAPGYLVGGRGLISLSKTGDINWIKPYYTRAIAEGKTDYFWMLTLDGHVFKLDINGEIILRGSSVDISGDNFYNLYKSQNGGLIITNQQRDKNILYFEKRNGEGIIEWAIKLGFSGRDSFTNVIEDAYENIYILIRHFNPNVFTLLKYDQSGQLLWSKRPRTLKHPDQWDINFDLTEDQELIMIGSDSKTRKSFVFKLDENGDLLWELDTKYQGGKMIKTVKDNGYIILGELYSGSYFGSTPYLNKLNGSGETEFFKKYRIKGTDMGPIDIDLVYDGFIFINQIFIPAQYDGTENIDFEKGGSRKTLIIKTDTKGESCN